MASPRDQYVHPEYLVETKWLSENMEHKNLRIVDCDNQDAYRRAHIPGAVNVKDNYYKNQNNRTFIMDAPDFATAMEDLGIGNNTLVIAYDGSNTLHSGRLWWSLNYYGHDSVKILNGGWNKWLQDGLPVGIDGVPVEPTKFTPSVNESCLATAEYVMAALHRPDVVLWDVRSLGEYTGQTTRGNNRSGHIPGAVHLEWLNNVTDEKAPVIKPAEDLRNMLEARGITPDKEVITY